MHNSLYYGEITNSIYNHFFKYADQLDKFRDYFDDDPSLPADMHNIAGDAAFVFSVVQDIFEKEQLDWHDIIKLYSDYLLDDLLIGETPKTIDMLEMMTLSVRSVH